MPVTDCRFFNGYRPCAKNKNCDTRCTSVSIPSVRIVVVHLEALGAVLRSTALLKPMHSKFPACHVTWVTTKSARPLIENNPLIDQIFTTEAGDLIALSALEFDIAYGIDKSLKAAGVLKLIKADLVYGFRADPRTGAILPANAAATELWNLGLSNQKKFFENEKPETQLIHEALELGTWRRDPYILDLTESEKREASRRRAEWGRPEQLVIGLNTGCSAVIPYKKLSVEVHRDLIERLQNFPQFTLVLLGGEEDTLRNQRISHGLRVRTSPTEAGLRDGMTSVAACDLVISGDSLGMHLAIALRKWTVAWFGPTCAQEIDFYDRGQAILSEASCSPCWKRNCERNPMCFDLVSLDELVSAVFDGEAHIRGAIDEPLSEAESDLSTEGCGTSQVAY